MKERTRNTVVGLTVIVALVLLAVLIVMFTGLPQWFQRGTTVHIKLSDSYEIQSGDPIYLLGKRVGMVSAVNFTDGDPLKGVTITATVTADVPLPRNIHAKVASRGLVGKKFIILTPQGPLPTDPDTGQPQRFYQDGPIILTAAESEAQGFLPAEVTDAMEDFGQLARRLNDLIGPTSQPASQPATDQAEPPPGLQGTIARMNRTLDGLYAMVGTEDNQKHFASALKNFSDASASADELMRQLMTDAEHISAVLKQLESAAAKMNDGQGTMGKLLNDPALYASMLDVSEQMELLMRDLRRLAEKWQTEGMGVKLK